MSFLLPLKLFLFDLCVWQGMMYVYMAHSWEVKHVEVRRQLSAAATLSLPHTLGQNSGCHACTGRAFIHRTISLVPLTSLSFLNAAEDRM